MPTAWRNGDFSSLLNPAVTGKGAIQLYNPYALNTTTGLRDPFAGNIIPASSIEPGRGEADEQHDAVSIAADQHVYHAEL